jgi:putative ABC transport system permease protein
MMEWFNILSARLRALFRRESVLRDIEEELRVHVEMETETNIKRGMAPDEARAAALKSFGNPVRHTERGYDIRGGGWLETLWQDLRYGARMLVKQPGFTLVVVVTLALGIGANTTIFSVVNAVLLRPLPFKESERLITLQPVDVRQSDSHNSVSYPNFVDWRAESNSFEQLAAFRERSFTLSGNGEPVRLNGAVVSADLFALLGIAPSLGRSFRAEDDKAGAFVVMLSHGLWQRLFNSDPQVIGRKVTLNNLSLTVVGVMPTGFQFPIAAESAELWTTVSYDSTGNSPMTANRGLSYLRVIGRLKPGVKIGQAQAEMSVIARRLELQYPNENAHQWVRLVSALDQLVGDVRRPLLVLFGAVGLVLLIACANVANLLLARAMGRRREMAVRSALGASRGRVVRQLLTESILLALVGCVCGWLLAFGGLELFLSLNPENIPRLQDIRLDGRVLSFTLLVSLLTGVIFGLAPATQASKTELTETLKEGGRSGQNLRHTGLRGVLVIAEVAAALVLMTGAGLLLNSLWRLLQVNPGFDPHGVLTLGISLPNARYSGPQSVEFYQRLQARLQTLPGVRAASASWVLPLSGSNPSLGVEIEGRPTTPAERAEVDCNLILPDHFRAMGMRLINGRDFTASDDLRVSPVVIINEAFKRRFFPYEDPIGKRIRPMASSGDGEPEMREIIGIVGDVKSSLTTEAQPEFYAPYAQLPITKSLTLALRIESDPRGLISAVRAEAQLLDKELPVFEIKTLDQRFNAAVAPPRFYSLLLAIFAGVALILTMIGLYGVMAYAVAQRTHEIGIRLALGAQGGDVLRMVVRQGMKLTLIGMLLGVSGALALTRSLKMLLFGVNSTDPLTFAGVLLLLFIVALVACWIPARRATKVDPMVALRFE